VAHDADVAHLDLLHALILEQRDMVSRRASEFRDARERHTLRRLRYDILVRRDLHNDEDELELDGLAEVMHAAERELVREERILEALEAERSDWTRGR